MDRFGTMNPMLEQMRTQFSAQLEGKEAFGPDSAQDTEHGDGEAGESGADNISDAFDAFDLYMDDIVSDLLDEYEVTEDEAIDFVFTIADEMAEAGELPEIPSDGDDEKPLTQWLGAAKSAGFEARVLEAASESADEAE